MKYPTRFRTFVVGMGLLSLILMTPLFAQDGENKTSDSKKQNAVQEKNQKDKMPVRIAEVNGVCEVWRPSTKADKNNSKENSKNKQSKSWEKATEGMLLPPGSGVSTGMKGRLVLSLAGEGSLIVKSLTQGKIGRLRREGKALTGEFKVKTGNVQVQIKEQEVDANFQVSTPRVTAAVKGSTVQVRARGDMGDSLFVQEGHMEARNPSYNQTYTKGQKAVQKMGKKEFHRAIETQNMERIADIMPSGIVEADSPQKLKEMAEKVVDIVTTDAGMSQGGFADSVFASYSRFERVHKTFHEVVKTAPNDVDTDAMHEALHATNGNPKALEDWFHKYPCGSGKLSDPERTHNDWHKYTLQIPQSSAGMHET